jgi:hypothetical protein
MIPLDMRQLHTISNSPSAPIPGFSTFIALICWHIWKAGNAKVFRNDSHSVDRVLLDCKDAAELWQFRFPRAKRQLLTLKNVHFVKLSKYRTDFTIAFLSSRLSKSIYGTSNSKSG